MSAAAVIVAIFSALAFVASIVSGFVWLILTSQGAPSMVPRFWFLLMAFCLALGFLFGWVAWS